MTHKNDRTARDLNRDPDFQLRVYGLADLGGPWAGWKLRGSHLVSPDRDRVTPEQLRGLLYLAKLKNPAPDPKRGFRGDGASRI